MIFQKSINLLKVYTPTSELAFSLILNLNRRIIEASQKTKKDFGAEKSFKAINFTVKP